MGAYWYESSIDRQLREATERGEFENLSGAGKPLAGYGGEYDEDWWVKDWLHREGATAGVVPPTLALRRAAEDLAVVVDRLHTEPDVRAHVTELNARIDKACRGHLDGPPVILPPFDEDAVVAAWRERKAHTNARPATGAGEAATRDPSRSAGESVARDRSGSAGESVARERGWRARLRRDRKRTS
ncbi:DUF1992 domain-containing protein [Actinoplanes sp. HUAS TT8]|uniref:DnaJ family domain-containing protein n=1 Tax=Actinoplanes sp. HUAS TT8 TaxID=3447453 RepID=UPI003F52405C